jgi:hypothetical protein
LNLECSETAWNRMKPWGYDQGTCIAMVAEHLLRSGKHQEITNQEDADCLAEGAEYATYEEKGTKRRRAISPTREPRPKRTTSASAIGAAPPAFAPPAADVVQALIAGLQHHAAASSAGPPPPPSTRPLGLEVATRPRGGVGGGATISMNEHEFRSIIDSANRARNSADQAHTLCLAAARQFQAEATVMEEVVAHLRGSLRN